MNYYETEKGVLFKSRTAKKGIKAKSLNEKQYQEKMEARHELEETVNADLIAAGKAEVRALDKKRKAAVAKYPELDGLI